MTSKTTVAILAAAAGREYEVPFTGAVSYLYAGEVAAAFLQAVSQDGDGAPAFDCNGTVVPVEDALEVLRRLAPGARVHAGGDPIPFPMEDQDALLRAHIGDYGAISLEEARPRPTGRSRSCFRTGRCRPISDPVLTRPRMRR